MTLILDLLRNLGYARDLLNDYILLFSEICFLEKKTGNHRQYTNLYEIKAK